MIRTTRSRSTLSKYLPSLLLAYLLLITPGASLLGRRAHAEPRAAEAEAPPAPRPAARRAPRRSDELLVRFRADAADEEKTALVESKGGRREKSLRGESRAEKVKLRPGQDLDAVAEELRSNPAVEVVEPNFVISRDEATPDDPRFPEQWALKNVGQTGGSPGADIDAPRAWETTTGAASTIVAVVDSGVDFSHPDLAQNQWTNPGEKANKKDDDRNGFADDLHGWDWITDTGAVRDEQGHGTAVAGIIAAQGNNAAGTSGVMWRAALMSLRVLDNTGTGDVADAVEAIDYAVAQGAQVINCSWGADEESVLLRDAIERAGRRGVVVVASAGNDGRDVEAAPYYPASFELSNLISVGSSDQYDQLAPFSNYGAKRVTIAAPGTDILTAQMGGGYRSVTGTSASAPLVAGVAGLVKTLRPWLTAAGARAAVIDGARRADALVGRVASGGVVSAAGALASLRGPENLPANAGGAGRNGGGAAAGNGAHPQMTPPPSGRGDDGAGQDGSYSVEPPARTKGAPASNLPNLDEARKAQNYVPKPSGTIRANLPCTDCDPSGGGGGGGGYYPSGDPMFATARTRPENDTGEPGVDLGSRNFNWSASLLDLRGRAGLDLNLTLYYNSLVWTREGSYIKFNADHGTPGPGFHLGFPFVQQRYFNYQLGVYAYMLVMPSGGRVELRQSGSSNVYESADSSYTQLIDNGSSALVRTKDGTQYVFAPVNGELRCTQIKDRNGNFIAAGYDGLGRILTVTDTLGRVVNFVYGGDQNLSAITQTWNGATHTWASFGYGSLLVQPDFPGLLINGPNNTYQTVLTSVTLDDGSYYAFDYTQWGQVWKIRRHAANTQLLNYVAYNLPGSAYLASSAQSDCPRFSERRDWADNWNGNNESVTSYSAAADGSWSQETTPDGVTYKEFFYTSGWAKGLPYQSEVWSDGVRRKWTVTNWTQDDPNLSYQINPRPDEVNVYDEAGNRSRTTIQYTSWGLPWNVRQYAADGVTVLRRRETQYRPDADFVNRHILGVVWMELTYDGESTLRSKLNFHHDWGGPLYDNGQAPSVGHDTANYGANFFGRANVTGVLRYNVNAPDDPNQAVWIRLVGYNLAGEPFLIRDAQNHSAQVSYADSFSDGVNRNTLAYPTAVTDGDNYTSTAQYNYDMGLPTRGQDPKGAASSVQYDGAGRVERVTNLVNNAYTRYVYSANNSLVQQFSTLQSGAGESYEFTIYDGAGRVHASGGELPGSAGGYRAQYFLRDVMGRVASQSNPTEITGSWAPAGDDAAGWVWTNQTYDWMGRPRVTTNPDGTTRESTYAGCGCAGGQQVTARDERGRHKRLTMDALGRLRQVEEMFWNQGVYSTTTYAYNALDQLTQINQAGLVRSFEYDGFARLWRRTTPEQGATTYAYNADDTVSAVTDARGATQTLGYNGRHLVTSVSYTVPAGVTPTANVTFGYDAAGNRTSMNDGLGSVSYNYNTLSQLTSETRTFSGLGSYTLSYTYELGGQLSVFTNPWGAQVGYGYDRVGRLTGVSGAGYAGVSAYAGNLQYRASNLLKSLTYGNGKQLGVQYDGRLRPSRWDVAGVMGYNYSYNNFYENTGRVTFAQNLYDPTLDRSYDYDHLGRVSSTHSGVEARSHVGQVPWGYTPDGPYSQDRGYDVQGNITTRTGWGGFDGSYTNWTAAYTNNRLTTNPWSGQPMSYDAAGNMTGDGGQVFQYDATGQQTYASYSGLYQYYDGNGLRAKKTENGATVYYLRSSVLGGQVVAEVTAGGTWQRGYVYMGAQLLALQYNGVYWVHQDPVAKSQRLTDASGSVVTWIEMDPWGGETSRSANSALQPHKYTTYERDGNGTDEAMFRRYHGGYNRFLQPDPYDGSYSLADPQSFNRYAYVQNDPVNMSDPTGLCAEGETEHTDPATGEKVCVPPVQGGSVTVNGGGDDPIPWSDLPILMDDFPRRMPVVARHNEEPDVPRLPGDLGHSASRAETSTDCRAAALRTLASELGARQELYPSDSAKLLSLILGARAGAQAGARVLGPGGAVAGAALGAGIAAFVSDAKEAAIERGPVGRFYRALKRCDGLARQERAEAARLGPSMQANTQPEQIFVVTRQFGVFALYEYTIARPNGFGEYIYETHGPNPGGPVWRRLGP